MPFDKDEWREMLGIADLEADTRFLLYQYSSFLDSRGRALAKPKVLAKATDLSVADVRKHLNIAKDAAWLMTVDIDGKKGYQACIPDC